MVGIAKQDRLKKNWLLLPIPAPSKVAIQTENNLLQNK
jgi:hypothetical protein